MADGAHVIADDQEALATYVGIASGALDEACEFVRTKARPWFESGFETAGIFELGGTRSSLDSLNLSRHWRNARTHTLHDPVRWKIQHIGRYVLNGQFPSRHGLL